MPTSITVQPPTRNISSQRVQASLVKIVSLCKTSLCTEFELARARKEDATSSASPEQFILQPREAAEASCCGVLEDLSEPRGSH